MKKFIIFIFYCKIKQNRSIISFNSTSNNPSDPQNPVPQKPSPPNHKSLPDFPKLKAIRSKVVKLIGQKVANCHQEE